MRPAPRPLPDEAAQLLESLVTRRRQLIEMITAEKNRRGFARGPVRRDITPHITWLEKRLTDVDGDLRDAVARRRQTLQGRGHRLHAETAHDPERDGASTATVGPTPRLTIETVANVRLEPRAAAT